MLTTGQIAHLDKGEPILVEIAGRECVVLSRAVYDRIRHLLTDDSAGTPEERDRLAPEAGDVADGA